MLESKVTSNFFSWDSITFDVGLNYQVTEVCKMQRVSVRGGGGGGCACSVRETEPCWMRQIKQPGSYVLCLRSSSLTPTSFAREREIKTSGTAKVGYLKMQMGGQMATGQVPLIELITTWHTRTYVHREARRSRLWLSFLVSQLENRKIFENFHQKFIRYSLHTSQVTHQAGLIPASVAWSDY